MEPYGLVGESWEEAQAQQGGCRNCWVSEQGRDLPEGPEETAREPQPRRLKAACPKATASGTATQRGLEGFTHSSGTQSSRGPTAKAQEGKSPQGGERARERQELSLGSEGPAGSSSVQGGGPALCPPMVQLCAQRGSCAVPSGGPALCPEGSGSGEGT